MIRENDSVSTEQETMKNKKLLYWPYLLNPDDQERKTKLFSIGSLEKKLSEPKNFGTYNNDSCKY